MPGSAVWWWFLIFSTWSIHSKTWEIYENLWEMMFFHGSPKPPRSPGSHFPPGILVVNRCSTTCIICSCPATRCTWWSLRCPTWWRIHRGLWRWFDTGWTVWPCMRRVHLSCWSGLTKTRCHGRRELRDDHGWLQSSLYCQEKTWVVSLSRQQRIKTLILMLFASWHHVLFWMVLYGYHRCPFAKKIEWWPRIQRPIGIYVI